MEAERLINSVELKRASTKLSSVESVDMEDSDIKELFKKADVDNSGSLTKTEFLAMYMAVAFRRIKQNPLVSANQDSHASCSHDALVIESGSYFLIR
jgi:Ca2+-binding EF-hand superfamily protein